jgi:hypothetical protein
MRMKKLMILAVAAIALVACSRTFEATKTEGVAIGFNTWAEHLTKGRAITDAAFTTGDTFNAFGSKVVNSNASVVFNGDVVTYGTPYWTYSPTRFWDPAATSYTFFAISPSGLLPEQMSNAQKETAATTGAFSTKEIIFNGTVENDVMIAKKTVVAQATYTGDSPKYDVNLDFNHVTALLDVKVKKSYSLRESTVKVTAISLDNIVYKGTFSVSTYDDSGQNPTYKPTVAIANWAPAASASTTDFTGTVADGGTTLNQYGYASVNNESLSGDANYFWQNFVVMPQTLVAANGTNPQQIKISYKIVSTAGEETVFTDKTVAFSAFDIVDNKVNTDDPAVAANAGWNPNIHYIYTLTLDANKIDFTASITGWDSTSVNGFYNLVN